VTGRERKGILCEGVSGNKGLGRTPINSKENGVKAGNMERKKGRKANTISQQHSSGMGEGGKKIQWKMEGREFVENWGG